MNIFLLLAGLLLVPFVASATGVPSVISYQGRLTNTSGNLLGGSGTNYYFKFSLWDSSTVGSGNRLWPTALPTAVQALVKQGVFNVNIGDTTGGYPDALDYDFSSDLVYLQIEVSSDGNSYETLTPRMLISSAAFAQVAGVVRGAGYSLGSSGLEVVNATTTNATTTNLTISGLLSSLLKTSNTGQVVAAIAGTDYFDNASLNSFLHASTTLPKTYADNIFSGLNIFNGNVTMGAATTSSFAITNILSSLLKTSANGSLIAAVAGLDYEAPITPGLTTQFWRGDKTWQTLDRTAVGLGNVENTALSSWLGSTAITTLGTISAGTWHGSAIDDSYISSAATWNAKLDSNGNGSLLTGLTQSQIAGLTTADTPTFSGLLTASSTITHLFAINSTTTNATTTNFYVSGNSNLLKLDQTTPQTTVGTFDFPLVTESGQSLRRKIYKEVIVDPNGNGDYTTIGAALMSVGAGYVVRIMPGTYNESGLVLPDGVSLIGESSDQSIIEDDVSGAILSVSGNNLISDLTIKNTNTGGVAINSSSYADATPNVSVKHSVLRGDYDTIQMLKPGDWTFDDCFWDGFDYDGFGIAAGSLTVTVKNSRVIASPTVSGGNEASWVNVNYNGSGSAPVINLLNNYVKLNRAANEGTLSYVRTTTAGVVVNSTGNEVIVNAGTQNAYGFSDNESSGAGVFNSHHDIITLTGSSNSYQMDGNSTGAGSFTVVGSNLSTKRNVGGTGSAYTVLDDVLKLDQSTPQTITGLGDGETQTLKFQPMVDPSLYGWQTLISSTVSSPNVGLYFGHLISMGENPIWIGTASEGHPGSAQISWSDTYNGHGLGENPAAIIESIDYVDSDLILSAKGNVYTNGTVLPLATGIDDLGAATRKYKDIYYSGQIKSSIAIGTAPFTVVSTTKVDNLNADLLDGLSSADFAAASHNQTASTITDFSTVARGLFSGSSPLTYNSGTGAIGINQASGSASGYLSNTDWTTFNNKLSSYAETDPIVKAVNGLVKSNGTTISAANAGTDYFNNASQISHNSLSGVHQDVSTTASPQFAATTYVNDYMKIWGESRFSTNTFHIEVLDGPGQDNMYIGAANAISLSAPFLYLSGALTYEGDLSVVGSSASRFSVADLDQTQVLLADTSNYVVYTATLKPSPSVIAWTSAVPDIGASDNAYNNAFFSGTVSAGLVTSPWPDLAENFPTDDPSIEAGELVAVDPIKSEYIKRAEIGDSVIGVVSTKPGLLLGKGDKSKPIALAGRVPVKVNGENGAIVIGDRVALSQTPGVGAKASSTAATVGIALQAFQGDSAEDVGTVMVLVDLSPELPSSGIFQNLVQYFSEIFADRATVKTLCLADDSGAETCVTKAQLDSLLSGQNVSPVPPLTNSDPEPQPPINEPAATSTSTSTPPIEEVVEKPTEGSGLVEPDLVQATGTVEVIETNESN